MTAPPVRTNSMVSRRSTHDGSDDEFEPMEMDDPAAYGEPEAPVDKWWETVSTTWLRDGVDGCKRR